MRLLAATILFVSAAPAAVIAVPGGQKPAAATAPAAQPAAAAPAAQPAADAPLPVESYTYQPDGRRDPFLSLIGTRGDTPVISEKGAGPAGTAVADVSVRGVLASEGTLIAMVQLPDNKTYIVHQGDSFLDGTIKTITPQGLVVVQQVNDPLSLVKQLEVRKLLRSLEDAKK